MSLLCAKSVISISKCKFCGTKSIKKWRKYCSRACLIKHRVLGNKEWGKSGYFTNVYKQISEGNV